MTELSFLLELLLNHKLPTATKKTITERIKVVEANLAQPQVVSISRPAKGAQSASTQRIIEEMEKDGTPLPVPVEAIAQTAAAAEALQKRQAIIQGAANAGPFGGKPSDGRSGPRKF